MIDTNSWTAQPIPVIENIRDAHLALDQLFEDLRAHNKYLWRLYDTPDPCGVVSSVVVRRGISPPVCVKQGPEAFRQAHERATRWVLDEVRPDIQSIKKPAIFIDVHYQIDSDCNTFGDFLFIRFALYRFNLDT